MKVEPIGHFSWLTFEILIFTFFTLVTDHQKTNILFEDINIKVYQPHTCKHNWKEKGGKSKKKEEKVKWLISNYWEWKLNL
jgi:hypothetical protein